jgi:ribosomal protein L24
MMRVLVCACACLWSACAGLSQRVDRSALDGIPNEELLVLFDAENAVYIARDEADLAKRNREDALAALSRAEWCDEVIAERRTSGVTIDSVTVLDMLDQWNDARIDMRKGEVRLRDAEIDTSDVRLFAARARYEREKAKLVKDKNPDEGASIEMADFDAQVKDWDAREKEALDLLKERNAEVSLLGATYFSLSRQLQTASKGAYGGPWADLLD